MFGTGLVFFFLFVIYPAVLYSVLAAFAFSDWSPPLSMYSRVNVFLFV